MKADTADLVSKLRTTLGKMEVALGAITEAIAWTDELGKVQWSNAAFDRLIAKSRFEILGTYLTDLLPLVQNGEPVAMAVHPVTLAFNHQMDSTACYEFRQSNTKLALEVSCTCLHLKEVDTSVVVAIRDITQRQQAEAELKRHQEQLQDLVEERTATLLFINQKLQQEIGDRQYTEAVLRESEAKNRALAEAATVQAQQLSQTLLELRQTQAQLVQSAKMSSLGQMVAGIAHEINNPVNFIYGNLTHTEQYTQNLLALLQLYQEAYPQPTPKIAAFSEAIELDFLTSDLPHILASMQVGTERIRQIVLSLRTFARLDEAERKAVDIHAGMDSTLLILENRLKAKGSEPEITVVKDYGDLPKVECYASQLNQVFMNILSNAIDALEDQPAPRVITIKTAVVKSKRSRAFRATQVLEPHQLQGDRVVIRIHDNGPGIPESVQEKLFEPFFTTKPMQKGTGLGLAISYQIIVDKHQGALRCLSAPEQGTEFWIEIPLQNLSVNS
jgi:two-component system NtrC family sensor kinase